MIIHFQVSVHRIVCHPFVQFIVEPVAPDLFTCCLNTTPTVEAYSKPGTNFMLHTNTLTSLKK